MNAERASPGLSSASAGAVPHQAKQTRCYQVEHEIETSVAKGGAIAIDMNVAAPAALSDGRRSSFGRRATRRSLGARRSGPTASFVTAAMTRLLTESYAEAQRPGRSPASDCAANGKSLIIAADYWRRVAAAAVQVFPESQSRRLRPSRRYCGLMEAAAIRTAE